jgi:hypothetical protein
MILERTGTKATLIYYLLLFVFFCFWCGSAYASAAPHEIKLNFRQTCVSGLVVASSARPLEHVHGHSLELFFLIIAEFLSSRRSRSSALEPWRPRPHRPGYYIGLTLTTFIGISLNHSPAPVPVPPR